MQINAFLDLWWWSKRSKIMVYKETIKKCHKKVVKRQLAWHNRPNSWDVNINFNLGLSQSSSSVANAKEKDLGITLDGSTGFADRS